MTMTTTSRTRRLLLATAAAVAAGTTLGTSPALAAHVVGPGPWKATNTYQAQADLNGRVAPRLNAIGEINHVRKGQWIYVRCQVLGEEAYGSRLWIKTARGQYVPDRYVKTYTDGFIPGVPRCPAPQAPAPQAPQPTPAPGPSDREIARSIVDAVAFEDVYGPKYGFWKAHPFKGISWDTNGCSVPTSLLKANYKTLIVGFSLDYSSVFKKSCDRHDFGYRNYGKGLKLERTDAQRAKIDRKLSDNMDLQCKKRFGHKVLEYAQRKTCFRVSGLFYRAVRAFGGSKFYG
jgi:hypothetical protein